MRATVLLAALVCADPAVALTWNGALGAAASDTDFYQVTCSDDGSGAPASLAAQVFDTAPAAAPLVSVQLQLGPPGLAINATDAVDGDAGASPGVALNGGAAIYDVFVDKSASGAESYTLSVQCMTGANGSGAATGTSLAPIATGPAGVPALSPSGLLWLGASLAALGLAALRRGRAAGLAALLAAFGLPADAWAHSQAGTLLAPESATDFYQVTCSDNGSGAPASLSLHVLDTAPVVAALVGVQVQRGSLARNGADAVDGDATPSPAVTVNGGAGVFDVLVYKTAAGAESYTLSFHCMTGPDGTGSHAGTSITTRQDQ